MKYSKNRKYRDREMVIEKEFITLSKKVKKNSKSKKESFFKKIGNKLLSWFKK
jgi:hypothetical protein